MYKCGLFVWLVLVNLASAVGLTGELNVPVYKMVRLSATEVPAKSVVFWDVTPEDLSDVEEFANGTELRFTGPPGKYKVKLRVVNVETLKVETLRKDVVIGGKVPPVPDIDPAPPAPPVPSVTPGFVIVVQDANNIRVDEGILISDPEMRKKLDAAGVEFRKFLNIESEAQTKYLPVLQKAGVSLPAMIVCGRKDSNGVMQFIKAVPLPKTSPEFLNAVGVK